MVMLVLSLDSYILILYANLFHKCKIAPKMPLFFLLLYPVHKQLVSALKPLTGFQKNHD